MRALTLLLHGEERPDTLVQTAFPLPIRVVAIVVALFSSNAQTLAAPVANNDLVSMADGQMLGIRVLDNDRGFEGKPVEVTILSQPDDATAWPMIIGTTHTVLVYRNPGSSGTDNFVYQVSDAYGNTSVATVELDVSCTNQCATVSLSWDTGPAAVTGSGCPSCPSDRPWQRRYVAMNLRKTWSNYPRFPRGPVKLCN